MSEELNETLANNPDAIERRKELISRLSQYGVTGGYINTRGVWIDTPTATLERISDRFDDPTHPGDAHPLVCTPGRYHPELHGTLILESGHHYRAQGIVDMPGYHILYDDFGQRRFVICAPEYMKVPKHSWGWQIQLYAARSRSSWGIGDFRDLALICRIAASQGASCVQVSPVHAIGPTDHPQPSPYSPASRVFLNLLHVAPGDVPGAERVDLSDLAAKGRALNAKRIIDRDKVWKIKREALERIWAKVKEEPNIELDAWLNKWGKQLHDFAVWSVLAEKFGTDWRQWPAEYRQPGCQAVEDYAKQHCDRVNFHSWAQWVAHDQYAAACREGVDVIADLAVGSDSASQDAWINQDILEFDFEIGAPPDSHNIEGQRWGLPPFNPKSLQKQDFRPFIEMVQATLRDAGAMRIDHVMQLWRLYWVPVSGTAGDGVYVEYPVDAMLAIIRLEAMRSNAWVVGEDMGTVAGGVRETMAAIGMLGNRSAMRTPVKDFPHIGVGTSSTHDQVTVAGLATGYDVSELKRIGKSADWDQVELTRRALCEMAHVDPYKPEFQITDTDIHDMIIERYRMMRTAPSLVVLISLDDAAMVKERPNMPGTIDQYPNWRIAMPRPVEDIMTSPLADELVMIVGKDRKI
uniref:4-alpha-glucanotransferase n=1 Tax=Vaginimicrobium propionicum TaxID=1871034 RepID=UPI0009712C60|nr:4-alpha-glucanotransferase [Vaginimicrobium propionicum]